MSDGRMDRVKRKDVEREIKRRSERRTMLEGGRGNWGTESYLCGLIESQASKPDHVIVKLV